MGGMIPAIERGFPQTEIANASYEYQHAIETGEQKIVGVNAFVEQGEEQIELLEIDQSAQAHQLEKFAKLKSRRDNAKVEARLTALRSAAAAVKTPCHLSWTPSVRTPLWAKSATCSARFSACTRKQACFDPLDSLTSNSGKIDRCNL